ncbi:MAG: hypothetical protein IT215_01660 [Chitinophagaceae bacterium]|nr:hypothetical protein [Candidatus Woesebacteria bacterium]MCC6447376.1 hypothetical protein [Chitinophagaceae bacterium]
MDEYKKAVSRIIKQQRSVMGPIAIDLARRVDGLTITNSNDIQIKGDGSIILSNLVNEYANLFGRAAVEVCKDAIKEMHPPLPFSQLPKVLQ